MNNKRSRFPGSHVSGVIGETQSTDTRRNWRNRPDPWENAPLSRMDALGVMTTKVFKTDGTGNYTFTEAMREFRKWADEGKLHSQLECLKAIA